MTFLVIKKLVITIKLTCNNYRMAVLPSKGVVLNLYIPNLIL